MREEWRTPAQSMDEMITEMNEKKEKNLPGRRHGVSLYKIQSGEYQETKTKSLVRMSMEELAEVATKERVSLSDADEVKNRTIIYLRACEASGTFPSLMGLARSLGHSRRSLNLWREKHPETETGRWLDIAADTFADIIGQSALKNNANGIVAIFMSKALYEMKETNELIIKPSDAAEREQEFNAEDIKARYMITEGGKTE